MECRRIIPKLDIKGPNLVKGIHLEGLRIIGKPEKFAEYYYENGADELIFMDTVASLYGRNSLHDIIKRVAKHIHIPMVVGGGIRTIDDISTVLRAGADRVSINTAAIQNPDFIEKAVKIFGSSTILIGIEAIKQADGEHYAFTDNGREPSGLTVVNWVKTLNQLGVGEIMVTSVDKEGTGQGYDYDLITKVCLHSNVSVIACGGAGKEQDFVDLFNNTNVTGASAAAIFHYKIAQKLFNQEDDYTEGNIEFIKKLGQTSLFKTIEIVELKNLLSTHFHIRKN